MPVILLVQNDFKGTDALFIALKALNIMPGDEVIVPSFTWVSTASCKNGWSRANICRYSRRF